MRKRPALKSFIKANYFAFKGHKSIYLGRAFMEVLYVIALFIAMKSVEYTTNSAYGLFEGTININKVIIGVSLFALGDLFFKVGEVLKTLLDNKLMLCLRRDFEYTLNQKLSRIKWEYYESHETAVELHKVKEQSLEKMMMFVEMGINTVYFMVGGVVFVTLLAQINLLAVIFYLILVGLMNKAFNKVYKQVQNAWEEIQPYKQKKNYFFHLSGDKITHQEFKFNRLFGFVSQKWEELYGQEYKIQMKIFRKYEITFQAARFLINLPYIAMLIFVGYEIAIGKHEIGFLLLCNTLFNHVLDLFGGVQYTMNAVCTQYGFIDSYFHVLDLEEENGEDLTEKMIDALHTVHFKEVAYAYPQAKQKSLKGVNLHIKAGEKIAVVGHNGSGKTTFTNLLLALTDKFDGHIMIEGMEGRTTELLQHLSSCILQDFAQYQMTIRENIEIGCEGNLFTDEEIWYLLQQVGLKELVKKLPKGIDTMLGQLEEGTDLSKGQWQRLAVARLLANSQAKIWILDEPTAYLDPISEIEVYELIYRLAGERIVLFISHRLGFAKRADRIMVFDDGIIKEEGSHSELIQKEGIYSEMYRLQETWYIA